MYTFFQPSYPPNQQVFDPNPNIGIGSVFGGQANRPTKTKWVHNENGEDRKLETTKRVRRWWTEHLGGTVLLTIRYGNKVIEFEEGKNAIELSSKEELEPTLQNIKKAVDNGEFDRLLEEQLAYGSHLKKYL